MNALLGQAKQRRDLGAQPERPLSHNIQMLKERYARGEIDKGSSTNAAAFSVTEFFPKEYRIRWH